VATLFPIYWQYFGLYLSEAKGMIVDAVPISLVEVLVWVGFGFGLILLSILMLGFWPKLKQHPRFLGLLAAGPILLILMGLGQGAFPLSLAPTAWRQPLANFKKSPDLAYPEFKVRLSQHEAHLLQNFTADYYESLTEEEILVGCNYGLDQILEKMKLLPGRRVRSIKPMGPMTTTLGLSYGGPAFHDPFLGEMAMVKLEDHPSPRYWRLIGICHETAHAKGFTREMDAEILTQVVLSSSPDLRYRLLGDIMYLRKSGERVHFPEYLRKEIHRTRAERERVEEQQTVITFLRNLSKKFGFQNSGTKYGSRDGSENWNPQHPFFSSVDTWLKITEAPLKLEPKTVGMVYEN
jgi:Protein of unknown function (DUF3810)